MENSSLVFEQKTKSSTSGNDLDVDKLYSKIGELQMEKDFLKKSLFKLGL